MDNFFYDDGFYYPDYWFDYPQQYTPPPSPVVLNPICPNAPKKRKHRRIHGIYEMTEVLLDYWEVDTQLTLNNMADLLELSTKRRLYDILNCLQAAQIIEKIKKNIYIRIK